VSRTNDRGSRGLLHRRLQATARAVGNGCRASVCRMPSCETGCSTRRWWGVEGHGWRRLPLLLVLISNHAQPVVDRSSRLTAKSSAGAGKPAYTANCTIGSGSRRPSRATSSAVAEILFIHPVSTHGWPMRRGFRPSGSYSQSGAGAGVRVHGDGVKDAFVPIMSCCCKPLQGGAHGHRLPASWAILRCDLKNWTPA